MERSASKRQLCCITNLNASQFDNFPNISITSLAIPSEGDSPLNEENVGLQEFCYRGTNGNCTINECANSLMIRASKIYGNITLSTFVTHLNKKEIEPDKLHKKEVVDSLKRKLVRLSCQPTESMWFDLMNSYGRMGKFLHVASVIGIILYFITSSDSGSLVIDCLSANGDPDPPSIQVV